MLTSSSTDSSRSSFSGSPVSQHPPHHQVWFPPAPRRRPQHYKIPRYYSTPVREDVPDSTPLQMYGLEERAPSIAEKPKLLRRFSHALDDIKEDLTLQPSSEKIRSKRRQSIFGIDEIPGSSGSISSPSMDVPVAAEPQPPRPRPLSILASEPSRRLSRRFSIFGSRRSKKLTPGQAGSISQPNLIGASTQI
ncbi:uncharacterized protein AKAW2_40482A [Aspergillus luchuensis]|uniref:Uncharacterized protein n=3 Tax=Aspergillus subgen. Circumdati TaxID=2720871 RepID=A0A146FQ56_ASPKA|nr:hypothetical protein BO85DRAFT_27113 [Aspergillus piperis CBS 112811]XP_041542562.1 uncharacterized protein AKAW2_40482A [Aspergillus luchuensis]OJZ82324.1 hypothetical protein ASPFODRAFT_211038 [Aspergillus luchuensis CBS 106.47]GAA88334.1 hypothetical protein AKAW_06448 [Aspergillus luchuensis IFO 4308]RAH63624.1 hypothetical protein BO85DRAFT_27113 [Aspergillus piperis CBS 112811]BCR98799.1 hypothetical protein AKAW2_40482A [Aspergillus luchuensis]BCS11118.1 hypothetical protein ALUC_40